MFGVMPPEVLKWEQDRFIHFILHHSDARYSDTEREQIEKTLYIKPGLGERRGLLEIGFSPCECGDREFGYKKEGAGEFNKNLKMWGTNEFLRVA